MVSKSVIGFTLVPEALETLNPNGSSAREPFFCFASPRPVATIVTFKFRLPWIYQWQPELLKLLPKKTDLLVRELYLSLSFLFYLWQIYLLKHL